MSGIDYEALAKAAYEAYWSDRYPGRAAEWIDGAPDCDVRSARAVVAALRDQGLVVVRRGLLDLARSSLASHETYHGGLIFQPELDEIDALVAAPSAEADA